MTTKEHLSQAEYKDFQSRRTRVVVGFCAVLSYALLLAVLKHALHVEPNLALLLACGFAIGIWVLFQLFGFKCPALRDDPDDDEDIVWHRKRGCDRLGCSWA